MHSALVRKQTRSPTKYQETVAPQDLSYIPQPVLEIGVTRLSCCSVDSWMLLGSALQATNNANPQLRNSHPASDIFAYKMMILIVNFCQTPAIWPVSISANLISSP